MITNCPVTHSDSIILKEYVDDKNSDLYKKYRGFHKGIDIEGQSVFSIFPGKIVNVGKDSGYRSIIIRYDNNNLIMYKHLKSIVYDVSVGQDVDVSKLLGYACKYVHVQYLSREKSRWPVRVNDETFYANDPTDIVTNGYESIMNYPDELNFSDGNIIDDMFEAPYAFELDRKYWS